MATRTTTKMVQFRRPFSLTGLDDVQPAGAYTIETDEALIQTLSFTAYRRTGTWIRIPERSSGLPGAPVALDQLTNIDPLDLEAALARDNIPGAAQSLRKRASEPPFLSKTDGGLSVSAAPFTFRDWLSYNHLELTWIAFGAVSMLVMGLLMSIDLQLR
jgi:hypothetical protein